jgi:uncharacterized protein YdgA (DUF945 family)
MKKVWWVLAVIVLAYPAYPWLIGGMLESRVNQELDTLLEQQPYVKVVERKWTRGWYRSEQEVTFEVFGELQDSLRKMGKATPEVTEESEDAAAVPGETADAPAADAVPPKNAAPKDAAPADAPTTDTPPAEGSEPPAAPVEPAKPWRLTVNNSVLHGPILGLSGFGIARVDTHLSLDEDLRKELREFFGNQKPSTLRTRLGFLGGGKSMLRVPAGSFSKPSSGKFTWEDIKFDVGFSRHADSFEFEGEAPRIELVNTPNGESLEIIGITTDGEADRALRTLYEGIAVFRVESIVGKSKSGEPYNMGKFEYLVDSDVDGKFMNVAAKFGIGKLEVEKQNLRDMHFDITAKHLELEPLEKLTKAMSDAYADPVDSANQAQTAVIDPWIEHGGALAMNDPEVLFDRVSVANADGEMLITGVLRLKGVTKQDAEMGLMALFGKLEADFDLKVTEKMVLGFDPSGGAKGQVDAYVQQGMLERKGGDLVAKLQYRSGNVTVNGKPVALPGFGGPPPPRADGMPEGMPEGMDGLEGLEEGGPPPGVQ